MEHRKNFISDQESLRIYFHTPLYSVFSLMRPASMQIYWNKRKRLHKKRVQLPQDWFGTQTWPPFHCFGTQYVMWKHTIMIIIFSSLYDWLISLTSSVSLKMFLLSECPKITHSHPMSLIMAGLEAKTHLHYKIMIYMYSCKIRFAQTAYLSIHLILLQ